MTELNNCLPGPLVWVEPPKNELEIVRATLVDNYIDNWSALIFITMSTSFTLGYFSAKVLDVLIV